MGVYELESTAMVIAGVCIKYYHLKGMFDNVCMFIARYIFMCSPDVAICICNSMVCSAIWELIARVRYVISRGEAE